MDRIDIKTAENQLKQEFIQGFGYPPRIAEVLVNTVTAHIRSMYSGERQDGQVIYRAVAKEEPAGKPLKECRLVSVMLTLFAKGDRKVYKESGLIALRRRKIISSWEIHITMCLYNENVFFYNKRRHYN